MSPDMLSFLGIIFGLFLLTSLGAGLHWLIQKSTKEDTKRATHDSPHTQPPTSELNSRQDVEHLDPDHFYNETDEEWRESYYGRRGGRSRDL